jgi:hypothetical protein
VKTQANVEEVPAIKVNVLWKLQAAKADGYKS